MSRSEALLDWYRRSARDLPWRATNDPYRILVSEVMLQQTQASRVVPYYERFVASFPTVEMLAQAPLADVLAAWSGLGYNNRARRLREAARTVVEHGWPTSAAGLRSLPGVGAYTAAAVASFAFGEQVAVVDTNVRRVLGRWHGKALSDNGASDVATQELAGSADAWNQAVMELGATVCAPRQPKCGECPVSDWCVDPSVYAPPPRQSTFEGSSRQVRSSVLRLLGADWTPVSALGGITHPADAVTTALESLRRDRLVEVSEDGSRARVAR